MRELWAQTKAFTLAVAVHVLMAGLVVLGTMTWKPFKPPALTGMTIEAVMVDTSAIKQRREEAKREAEKAAAQKIEKDRREKELQERRERLERERLEAEAAEKQRQKDLALKKRRKICAYSSCAKNRSRIEKTSSRDNRTSWTRYAKSVKRLRDSAKLKKSA